MAFVSTRPYVSLLKEINQKKKRLERREKLAKAYNKTYHTHTYTHTHNHTTWVLGKIRNRQQKEGGDSS